jgi:hypothetical protein
MAVVKPLGNMARQVLAKLRICQGGFNLLPHLGACGIRRQRCTHTVRGHLGRALQTKRIGQHGPGGVRRLAQFGQRRLGEDSPAPLSAAVEDDLESPEKKTGKPFRLKGGQGYRYCKENQWVKDPQREEWDVQHPSGSHTNVSENGEVTHGADNFPGSKSITPR